MNKRRKEAANMFFSAFLVIAYVVCCYFIMQLASTVTNATLYSFIIVALVVLFGLLLFYATRVGDGKQVKRFSPSVLILIVLPSIYVISAYFAVGLPLHEQILNNEMIMYLASVALGYGIPYTFTSGFEMVAAEDVFYPERSEKKNEEEEEENEEEEEDENEDEKE